MTHPSSPARGLDTLVQPTADRDLPQCDQLHAEIAPSLDLPDDIRIPLHSLQADIAYLFGRVALDKYIASPMADSVLDRLSQIETGIYRLMAPLASSPQRQGDRPVSPNDEAVT